MRNIMKELLIGFFATILVANLCYQGYGVYIHSKDDKAKEVQAAPVETRISNAANVLKAIVLMKDKSVVPVANSSGLTVSPSQAPPNPEIMVSNSSPIPLDASTGPQPCVIWGPLSEDNVTKGKVFISTYDQSFIDKVKSYNFYQRTLYYVVTAEPMENKAQSEFLKKMSSLNVPMEKIIFLDDGRAWINSFVEEELANNYIEKFKSSKIELISVPEAKNQVYYYILNPELEDVARMIAFRDYFPETKTVETECLSVEEEKSIKEKLYGKSLVEKN